MSDRDLKWYCTEDSQHEHSTEWEAENCSQMGALIDELDEQLDTYAPYLRWAKSKPE